MIAAREQFPKLTPEEYFVWEEQQLEKHEYIDGKIYALGDRYRHQNDNKKNHSSIAVAFSGLIFNHLQGHDYEIENSDLKIKILDSQKYVYSDVVVTRDERDKENTQFVSYPCLVIEVLSKTTEAYDRGGKFRLYQKNSVLQDYLLVSSTSIEVDLYHKNDAGEWLIKNYQAGDTIELKSISLSFSIEEIYQGLTLTDKKSY